MEENNNQNSSTEINNASGTQVKKTSLGMEENLEGLLCYLFGWITGLIFMFAEKDNKFVRFHAIQSLILGITATALYIILDFIIMAAFWYLWSVISLITSLIMIGYLILTIFLMYKAYKKDTFKLPVIGNYAEKATNK